MRKTKSNRLSGMLIAVFAATLWVASAQPAQAGKWWVTQGANCRVEWASSITSTRTVAGWGTDFTLADGTNNWVHCNMTGPGDAHSQVRNLKLTMRTGDFWAWVSEVHIYNGYVRVAIIDVDYSLGWNTYDIDLGARHKFQNGLNIAIHVNAAGIGPVENRFQFSTFKAYYVNSVDY